MIMRDYSVTNSETANFPTQRKIGAPTRRLLRLKAAAEYLSLSPWKVRSLIQAGRLPVVQDGEGSPFLLDVRDLDGYVERNKRLTPL
jgi:excisionase family DNA binding protein